DGFVTRLSADGRSLDVSTLIGGNSVDIVYCAKENTEGDLYLTGYTDSWDFPTTPGAYQTNLKGMVSHFVTKMDHNVSSLEWSTFVGGSAFDIAMGICPLEDGVCVLGYSTSNDFPTTKGAIQGKFGGDYDAVLYALDDEGKNLLYSTYLGGTGFDVPSTVSYGGNSTVLVTGFTYSATFPTTDDAYQPNLDNGDAFITRILLDTVAPVADAGTDIAIDQHETATFNGTASRDNLEVVNWTWTFIYEGTPVVLHGPDPSFTFHEAGEYMIDLEVRDGMDFTGSDSILVTVRDITPPSADAGSSRIVNEHQTIIMDGSSSTDNVNVANWTWTFTYEGATVTIHGPNPEFT
ncbi:MAG: PKD domain-containing protein, partial [Thermoplasmata archaeon]|nr:PKD domain-containing protein [Thermoplasmata archaeon]